MVVSCETMSFQRRGHAQRTLGTPSRRSATLAQSCAHTIFTPTLEQPHPHHPRRHVRFAHNTSMVLVTDARTAARPPYLPSASSSGAQVLMGRRQIPKALSALLLGAQLYYSY